ncbi:MAG: hypothetical protein ACI8WB_000907 [Phenylobacterium sp.]|jgi:hypothetical protein
MDLKEATLLKLFVSALLLLIVTGTLNLLWPMAAIYQQMLSLLHLLSGVLSSGIAIFYAYKHTRQTLGFRRVSSVIIGASSFIAFLVALVTGIILSIAGVTEVYQGYLLVHDVASYLCVALLGLHIVIHLLTFPTRRLKNQGGRLITLDLSLFKSLAITAVAGIGFLSLMAMLNAFTANNTPQPQPVDNYSYNYSSEAGKGKFLPSMASTEGDRFIAEDHIAQSKSCINCHQTIGEQWLASTHRHAADDPTYVRNINLLEKKKGIEATRYCEGCHAPIALLTGQLSQGGKHAGVAGTTANHEGISCMSCHGVDKIHSTQGNASYNFVAKQDYLFEHSDQAWLKTLNHLSIKLRPQQHKQDLLAPVLQTATFCSSCHSQFMDKSMNNWGWVKMQNEYLAWSNSKFNQSRDTRFSHPESKNCQSCHMPQMAASGMSANHKGEVSSHYFVGANMMLAKQFNNHKLAQLTEQFLQQDKISIYIVPPEDQLAQQSALFVNPDTGLDRKYPVALYRGETRDLTVLVNNHGVGHNFPGGSIDLNEAWIAFKVIDGAQREVYSSGHLLPDDSIEPKATVYKETALNQSGEEVWRHDLFNMVGRSYINVVPAGATDVIEYKLSIPDWAVSPLNISATLKFRKLNPKYLHWVELEQDIVANPVVDIARDSLSVTLRKVEGIQ